MHKYIEQFANNSDSMENHHEELVKSVEIWTESKCQFSWKVIRTDVRMDSVFDSNKHADSSLCPIPNCQGSKRHCTLFEVREKKRQHNEIHCTVVVNECRMLTMGNHLLL